MAKQNKKPNQPRAAQQGVPAGQQPKKVVAPKAEPKKADGNSFWVKYREQLIVAGIAIVTYLSLKAGLANGLTNWDDNGYLNNDPLIKDVSWDGIKAIFSTENPVMGNYHPLTILSYAIEYSYKGLEPYIYHLDSLLIHILTTVSVYLFVRVLSRNVVAAGVVALLFGVHPMHVESVAWAAGRKDVLYVLFFMLSCTAYVYYVRAAERNKKILWMGAVLALYVLSLLCKAMAVVLPVVLIAIDYYERRKPDIWLVIDKIPGFAISLWFGILSIAAQKKFGAYDKLDISFNTWERFTIVCHNLFFYLWKAVVPAGLCCYYPYPARPDGYMPVIYYISVPIVLGLVALVVWKWRNRVLVFGSAFFMITIFMVLQIKPVGSAIMADRYTYLPYVGLFFIPAWYIGQLWQMPGREQLSRLVTGAVVVYALVLGYVSSERCAVWYDSVTLWRDEVDKHPESPNAYNNLGAIYSDRMPGAKTPQERETDYDSSMYYLRGALSINPKFTNSLVCLGILLRTHNGPGELDSAIAPLALARAVDPGDAEVYMELGVIYGIKHMLDSSEYNLRKAVTLKPFFPEAYANIANLYDIEGKPDSSLAMYSIAIKQNPDAYIPYLNRARIYTRMGKYADAMKDYNMAAVKSPEMAEIYASRSQCYTKMGNANMAKQDMDKAVALGYRK